MKGLVAALLFFVLISPSAYAITQICPDFDGDNSITILDLTATGINMNSTCYFRKDADLNNDCRIDRKDLDIVGQNYGCASNCTAWDVNKDGLVNILDLAAVGLVYGQTCYVAAVDYNKDCIVNKTDLDIVGEWYRKQCCTPNDVKPCGTDVGACKRGNKTCTGINNEWSGCRNSTNPVTEACNSLDDNCDGIADDNLTRECGTSIGICKKGTSTCANGIWNACIGSVMLGTESCNGLDDDCDSIVDEGCICTTGLSQECGTGLGACRKGTQNCTLNGTWGACVGSIDSYAEVCDGIDNDCDGFTDENLTRQCGTTNVGICAYGAQSCANGTWEPCRGEMLPANETCNGLDDNCDGGVDENLMRECGSSNMGECRYGLQPCFNGNWGACMQSREPENESCNGLDDDCDGFVDETCPKKIQELAQTIIRLETLKISLQGIILPIERIADYYERIGDANRTEAWRNILKGCNSLVLAAEKVKQDIKGYVDDPSEYKLMSIKNGIVNLQSLVDALLREIIRVA